MRWEQCTFLRQNTIFPGTTRTLFPSPNLVSQKKKNPQSLDSPKEVCECARVRVNACAYLIAAH